MKKFAISLYILTLSLGAFSQNQWSTGYQIPNGTGESSNLALEYSHVSNQLYLSGNYKDSSNSTQLLLAAFDTLGNPIWSKATNHNFGNLIHRVQVSSDGGLYVLKADRVSTYLYHLNSSGLQQWGKQFPSNGFMNSVKLEHGPSQTLLLCQNDLQTQSLYLTVLDQFGNELVSKKLQAFTTTTGDTLDFWTAYLMYAHGSYYLIGQEYGESIFIGKLDENLNFQWFETFSVAGTISRLGKITPTASGFLISGAFYTPNVSEFKAGMLVVDSLGQPQSLGVAWLQGSYLFSMGSVNGIGEPIGIAESQDVVHFSLTGGVTQTMDLNLDLQYVSGLEMDLTTMPQGIVVAIPDDQNETPFDFGLKYIQTQASIPCGGSYGSSTTAFSNNFVDTINYILDTTTIQLLSNSAPLNLNPRPLYSEANCMNSTLGQEEVEKAFIKGYPNPGDGIFHIQGSQAVASFKAYGLNGQLMKVGSTRPDGTIDLTDLPNNLYLIQLITEQETHTLRYLKQ